MVKDMSWFKDRLQAVAGARRSKRPLYALLLVLAATVGTYLSPEIAKAIESWVTLPKTTGGRMTLFGVPILAWGVAASGLCFGWWMLEYVVHLRKKLKPALSVFYDDDAQDCHKPIHLSSDGGKTHHNGRSIRLRISCNSDVNVEQCSGFLTKITYRAHGGQFSDISLFEPAYLHWAMEALTPFEPVTVYPRVSRYLGICHTDEIQQGFSIRLRHRSYVTPELFDKPGEYEFHIEIVAARAPTISKTLLITWNGQWNEIRACLAEST